MRRHSRVHKGDRRASYLPPTPKVLQTWTMLAPSSLRRAVLDTGTYETRAGFAGQQVPLVVSSMVESRQRARSRSNPMAGIARPMYHTSGMPLHQGVVVDWEAAELLWRNVVDNLLGTDPGELALLMSESPMATRSSRRTTAQLMFETFGVAALAMRPTSTLGLIGSKGDVNATSVLVNVGDQVTTVVPVVDGVSFKEVALSTPVGGASVSEFLGRLLAPSGKRFDSAALCRELTQLKERFCVVATSAADPRLSSSPTLEYMLPDGTCLRMQNEPMLACETLFNPSVAGLSCKGIPDAVNSVIASFPDLEVRRELAQNVTVVGATSGLSHFAVRLQKELREMPHCHPAVVVECPPQPGNSVFLGGSVVASMPTTLFVTREEYDEFGPSLIDVCFD